ncbi:MAG: hypothetical protein JXB34_15515 [Bacteroidales bacterium]|nr:hypothetical protein [Bacteroidales bacterium]
MIKLKTILKTLSIVYLAFSIAGCKTETARATTYYVSNRGSDNASGKSPATAWKTIEKVNSRKFSPGDSVLFEAGGVWRETLRINKSGAPGSYIVYSRFGVGANPQILGSVKAADWSKTGTANIWKTSTAITNFSQEHYAGRMFFVKNDSVAWGRFVGFDNGFSNLTSEFDYTVNGTVHYIFSVGDPNSLYESVEVAQRKFCVQTDNTSYIEMNGIDLMYSRYSGYFSGYPEYRGASNLIIRNCNIGYIGRKGSGYAYGIEMWHSNSIVENCTITDCGRRAISMNLYNVPFPPGQERAISNVVIRNNVFKRGYHTTGLDLACNRGSGDTIRNIYYYNNIHDDSELAVTPEDETSNQLFLYNIAGDYVNEIYVYNNIFIKATARNILAMGCDSLYFWNNTFVGHNPKITAHPYGNVTLNGTRNLDYRNNILYDNLPKSKIYNYGLHAWGSNTNYIERDYNLYFSENPQTDRCFTSIYVKEEDRNYYYTTTVWNEYRYKFPGYDKNSPRPQNPAFIDYKNHNFRLTENSPAKMSGTAVEKIISVNQTIIDTLGIYDFSGALRSKTSPSIGAFE